MGFQLKDGDRRPGVSPDRQVDAQVIQAAWAGRNLAGGELQVPWVLGLFAGWVGWAPLTHKA